MNLRLLQLGDSALPIGGYSQSWGLEAAVACGIVRTSSSLETWLRQWLRNGVGPFEGTLAACACRGARQADWRRVREANDHLSAGLSPPTIRNASLEMGEQLLTLAEVWPWATQSVAQLNGSMISSATTGPWHHAVVFGTLAAAAEAEPRDAVAVYLHQAALGCIGAGVRAIPIGHTHGQQILARMHGEIEQLAEEVADRDLQQAGSFSPAHEVLCHDQSHLYTRLFRS